MHEEEDQRYCLQLGQEAGLDMAKVIKALVEMEMVSWNCGVYMLTNSSCISRVKKWI